MKIILASLIFSLGTLTAVAHDPVADMTAAAQRYLQSLTSEQLETSRFDWKDDKRQTWNFLPDRSIKPHGKRFGLRWDKMKPQQRLLAQSLLTSALSNRGHNQTMTVMALEQILHDLEKKNPMRNPEFYYVSIFGKPTAGGTWSWRFEGHHLSINVTIVDGKQVALTPTFFGGNPAIVKTGNFAGLEVLADEQKIARSLVTSLTEKQLTKALLSKKAPRDIYSRLDRKVQRDSFDNLDRGITLTELSDSQRNTLTQLVTTHTEKFRPELLRNRAGGGVVVNDSLRFAWAGSLKPGQGHYYRIVTDRYLIEYDNVQGGANHIHAVWRDFDGDFGNDLLRTHYKESAH
jgi:hypothetical protein